MRAGGSKAATMIKQSALAPSPQPRPAPTARALPSRSVAQGGQNWTPIRGQIWKPIDTMTKCPQYNWMGLPTGAPENRRQTGNKLVGGVVGVVVCQTPA